MDKVLSAQIAARNRIVISGYKSRLMDNPDLIDQEIKVRGRPIFFPTLYVRKTGKCHRGA